ncbi:GNAT family N-acetyltransferase [Spongorhabdus nitratireducens]
MLEFRSISPQQAPLELLLEADPSEACIRSYLADSGCFAAFSNQDIVGVCVVKQQSPASAELFNIAVSPRCQSGGIGSRLLQHVLLSLKSRGINSVELGTGTFGYQLTFYQRLGFRATAVIRNFFLDHYDFPVMENGIQHKDMLRLECDLGQLENTYSTGEG